MQTNDFKREQTPELVIARVKRRKNDGLLFLIVPRKSGLTPGQYVVLRALEVAE